MEIDLNIEKEITKLQEAKMHGNLKKVVPEDFDIQLGVFFSTIAEEKKDLEEKIEKDKEKIQAFEKLFTNLTAKKKEVKKKKVLLLEPEEVVNEIRVAEKEAAGSIMEYLLPKEVAEYDEDIISQVSKQISEMQVATELDKDKIRDLESIDSLDKLKKEFVNFKDIVAHQLGSLGGGGLNPDKVDAHLIPVKTNTFNLGSSSLRFNDLFLAGNTIDLAGSTISADGTGTIAISAAGVTLPVGSKVGTTAIAKAADNGQSIVDVKFFSADDGLSTANATFQFAGAGDTYAYTTSGTFTMSDGTTLEAQDKTLFKF